MFNTALALPALKRTGMYNAACSEAAMWLVQIQNADGGWGWYGGYLSDPVSTALAVSALKSLNVEGESVYRKAYGWIMSNRRETEGEAFWSFVAEPGQGISTVTSTYTHFSTPYCISALVALGAKNEPTGQKAVKHLLKLQDSSGGWPFMKRLDWFKYDMSPLPWSTGNAISALLQFL